MYNPESLADTENSKTLSTQEGFEPSARKGENSEVATNSQVPPDGGLQAWLCVLGACLCQFSSFGFLNA